MMKIHAPTGLNINKTWTYYAFNGELLWNDNVINRRWNETDTTLQQMPMIMFDSLKQSAFGTGIYWDIESEATYFTVRTDSAAIGPMCTARLPAAAVGKLSVGGALGGVARNHLAHGSLG